MQLVFRLAPLCLIAVLAACASRPATPALRAGPEAAAAAATPEVVTPTVESEPSVAPPGPWVVGDRFLTDAQVAAWAGGRAAEQWFGVYIGGRKVGFAQFSVRPAGPDEPGGYVSAMEMQLEMRGQSMKVQEVDFFTAESPYRLVERRTMEATPSGTVSRRFVAAKDAVQIVSTVDGVEGPARRLPPTCATLEGDLVTIFGSLSELEVGQTATYCSFSSERERDERTRFTVANVEERVLRGVESRVATIEMEGLDDGTRVKTLFAGGVPLEVSLGGIVLKAEERNVATSDLVGMNFTDSFVRVDRPLGKPGALDRLSLRVKVADGFEIPSSPNQTVTREADGWFHVEIRRGPGDRVTADERAAALAETGEFDYGDPSIRARAEALVKGTDSRSAKVRAISAWVYQAIEGSLDSNLATASQVMRQRAGDCTEYTLLFVALARAAGIPAREVGGVTYAGDSLQAFGWHAWAEVEIDGHWVQVDPSWNEPVANATHLRLGSGDNDNSITTLGSLAIEVR